MHLSLRTLPIVLFALSAVSAACSLESTDASSGSIIGVPSTRPEAVLLTVTRGTAKESECNGVLIAPRVVLTSAFCVNDFYYGVLDTSFGNHEPPVVTIDAPNANGQTAKAARAYNFDYSFQYTLDDQRSVALVVLETPITIPTYAEVDTDGPAPGSNVIVVGRDQNQVASNSLWESAPVAVSDLPGSPHRFQTNPVGAFRGYDIGGPAFSGPHRVVGEVWAHLDTTWYEKFDGLRPWIDHVLSSCVESECPLPLIGLAYTDEVAKCRPLQGAPPAGCQWVGDQLHEDGSFDADNCHRRLQCGAVPSDLSDEPYCDHGQVMALPGPDRCAVAIRLETFEGTKTRLTCASGNQDSRRTFVGVTPEDQCSATHVYADDSHAVEATATCAGKIVVTPADDYCLTCPAGKHFRGNACVKDVVIVSVTPKNGVTTVKLRGEPLTTYSIEASTDLVKFAPVGNVVSDGQGDATFVDPKAASSKFYRARDVE